MMENKMENKKIRWWVVIKNDSWLSKSHGAFSLGFLANNGLLDGEQKAHLHTTRM